MCGAVVGNVRDSSSDAGVSSPLTPASSFLHHMAGSAARLRCPAAVAMLDVPPAPVRGSSAPARGSSAPARGSSAPARRWSGPFASAAARPYRPAGRCRCRRCPRCSTGPVPVTDVDDQCSRPVVAAPRPQRARHVDPPGISRHCAIGRRNPLAGRFGVVVSVARCPSGTVSIRHCLHQALSLTRCRTARRDRRRPPCGENACRLGRRALHRPDR